MLPLIEKYLALCYKINTKEIGYEIFAPMLESEASFLL